MKVLVADNLSEEGIGILKGCGLDVDVHLKKTEDELVKLVSDYDAMIVRSGTRVTKKIIRAGKLKVIGRAGVGVDNIDVDAATRAGIIVMNTPLGNINSAAEHTIAMILALSRNIPQGDATLKNKQWERKKLTGVELEGKTLAVIGMGNVGRIVCRIAQGFRMKIIAHDPFVSEEFARDMDIRLAGVEECCREGDYLTVHTPLNEKTRNLISDKELALMKRDARIINVARGGIINERALYAALKDKTIAGAAIDVWEKEPPFDSPLLTLSNVIATPHLGASTEEAQRNVAIQIAEQVCEALMEGNYLNSVNMPFGSGAMKKLSPFLELAEKLGTLQSQITRGGILDIEAVYVGLGEEETRPLTAAVIKGLLQPMLNEPLNLINANQIAKERNIKVTITTDPEPKNYNNLITVTVKTDKGTKTVGGTLFGDRHPRIVRIDRYHMDAKPVGNLLIVENNDVPGVIGRVGTFFGDRKINIGEYRLGRAKSGKKALAVINLDNGVPDNVIQEFKMLDDILDVKQVIFHEDITD
ncbi:MAG: phosphoglycerate dehydrogenase [archaeon]